MSGTHLKEYIDRQRYRVQGEKKQQREKERKAKKSLMQMHPRSQINWSYRRLLCFWRVLIVIHDAAGFRRNWGWLFLKCWIREGFIDHCCWGGGTGPLRDVSQDEGGLEGRG